MNDLHPTTAYVSRVVAVPPGLARQLFDAGRLQRQLRAADPDRWSVTTGPVTLQLDGPGLVPGSDAGLTLRACPGRLRASRRTRPVPVALELAGWSRERTELGMRHLGRRRPGPAYFDAAAALLEGLARELELRALLALHPQHSTGTTARRAASPVS